MGTLRNCSRACVQFTAILIILSLSACAASTYSDPYTTADILVEARSSADWIVNIRRELHSIPELGSTEFKTSAAVKRVLDELGIKYKPVFNTGVVATIGSGVAGTPTIALRADMDALPVEEPAGLPFVSTHPGRMHACGHDGHTSMLLGAAKLLRGMEAAGRLPPGTVRLVFQPNEEFGAGGDHVIKEGALDGVQAAFGMHVAPWLPTGTLATRPGTIMAGALSFHVNITGRGGHAAMPHLNVDPIVAAASIISTLQTLVSRETSPLASGVLSVTLLSAGHAYNVIPDVAQFGGTIRALDHAVMDSLRTRMEALITYAAVGFNCKASISWREEDQPYYPPTVNDPASVQFSMGVARRLLGEERVSEAEPIMAGEDFSFYCQKVPCTFAFLGIHNTTLGNNHALHNPRFMLDESVLPLGAAMHAAWALEYLATHQPAATVKEEL